MSWLGHSVAGRGWSARPHPSSAPRLGVVCLPPPPSDQQRSPRRLPGTPPWHSLVGEDLAQGSALGSDREGLLSNPADTTGLPAARKPQDLAGGLTRCHQQSLGAFLLLSN